MNWPSVVAGLTVGLLVGLTGVGGGSLMAPILILIFGFPPAVAIGTDLWFAAITKTVGGVIHHHYGGPDFQIIRRLCYGSLPACIVTLWFLAHAGRSQIKSGTIIHVLGIAIVLTAIATLLRSRLQTASRKVRTSTAETFLRVQPAMTVLAGAVLGVLVTLTSVGAGALAATMLVVLYPLRLTPRRLVGTDIVHAVPLTLIAGLGHLWIGNVNTTLLGQLLLGSLPGIIIGSLLATRLPDFGLRTALAGVLVIVGLRMLAS